MQTNYTIFILFTQLTCAKNQSKTPHRLRGRGDNNNNNNNKKKKKKKKKKIRRKILSKNNSLPAGKLGGEA
jgi:hypothetical protein